MFCCGQPTEMPRRSYTTLLAWTTTWERMDRGANCSRLWNISFSIFPINPNLISLLSTDMYRSSWYSCWPIKGRRAATPRVDSSPHGSIINVQMCCLLLPNNGGWFSGWYNVISRHPSIWGFHHSSL